MTTKGMHQHHTTGLGTLFENFRAASEGLGKHCALRNELRIRKGRRLYLFTCGECELRLVVSGRADVSFLLAPDTTVSEFRRCIAALTASPERQVDRIAKC